MIAPLKILFRLSFLILTLIWVTGCTPKKKQMAQFRLDLSSLPKRSEGLSQSTSLPQFVILNVSWTGQADIKSPLFRQWSNDGTATSVPPMELEVPSGLDLTVQALAGLENATTGGMNFYYKDAVIKINANESKPITLTLEQQGVTSSGDGSLSGRFLDTDGTGPTSKVDVYFIVPNRPDRRMKVMETEIIGGWFRLLALEGISFDYVLENGRSLFGGPKDLTSIPLDDQRNLRVRIPNHFKGWDDNVVEGREVRGPSRGVFGYFGPGSAGKKICYPSLNGTVPYAYDGATSTTKIKWNTACSVDPQGADCAKSAFVEPVNNSATGGVPSLDINAESKLCELYTDASRTTTLARFTDYLSLYVARLAQDDQTLAFDGPFQMFPSLEGWDDLRTLSISYSPGLLGLQWTYLPGVFSVPATSTTPAIKRIDGADLFVRVLPTGYSSSGEDDFRERMNDGVRCNDLPALGFKRIHTELITEGQSLTENPSVALASFFTNDEFESGLSEGRVQAIACPFRQTDSTNRMYYRNAAIFRSHGGSGGGGTPVSLAVWGNSVVNQGGCTEVEVSLLNGSSQWTQTSSNLPITAVGTGVSFKEGCNSNSNPITGTFDIQSGSSSRRVALFPAGTAGSTGSFTFSNPDLKEPSVTRSITVVAPSSPTRLEFRTPTDQPIFSQMLNACREVRILTRNDLGAAAPLIQASTVNLITQNGLAYYSNSSCTSLRSSILIPQNASTTPAGALFVRASSTGWKNLGARIDSYSDGPSGVMGTSTYRLEGNQGIIVGNSSTAVAFRFAPVSGTSVPRDQCVTMKIEATNADSAPVPLIPATSTSPAQVSLSSSEGSIYAANDTNCGSPLGSAQEPPQVTFLAGASSATFRFRTDPAISPSMNTANFDANYSPSTGASLSGSSHIPLSTPTVTNTFSLEVMGRPTINANSCVEVDVMIVDTNGFMAGSNLLPAASIPVTIESTSIQSPFTFKLSCSALGSSTPTAIVYLSQNMPVAKVALVSSGSVGSSPTLRASASFQLTGMTNSTASTKTKTFLIAPETAPTFLDFESAGAILSSFPAGTCNPFKVVAKASTSTSVTDATVAMNTSVRLSSSPLIGTSGPLKFFSSSGCSAGSETQTTTISQGQAATPTLYVQTASPSFLGIATIEAAITAPYSTSGLSYGFGGRRDLTIVNGSAGSISGIGVSTINDTNGDSVITDPNIDIAVSGLKVSWPSVSGANSYAVSVKDGVGAQVCAPISASPTLTMVQFSPACGSSIKSKGINIPLFAFVEAFNSSGGLLTAGTLSFTFNPSGGSTAPTLSYYAGSPPNPIALSVNLATTITPVLSTNISSCYVKTPPGNLPPGLSLSSDCVITGTPTTPVAQTTYTIVAGNAAGVTTEAPLILTVSGSAVSTLAVTNVFNTYDNVNNDGALTDPLIDQVGHEVSVSWNSFSNTSFYKVSIWNNGGTPFEVCPAMSVPATANSSMTYQFNSAPSCGANILSQGHNASLGARVQAFNTNGNLIAEGFKPFLFKTSSSSIYRMFVEGPLTSNPGVCTTVYVSLVDTNMTPVNATNSVLLNLSSSASPGVHFYPNCKATTAIPSITIPTGSNGIQLGLKASSIQSLEQFDFQISSTSVQMPYDGTFTVVQATEPTRLEFVSSTGAPLLALKSDGCEAVQIQAQNASGTPRTPSQSTDTNLYLSGQHGVTFYEDSGCSTQTSSTLIGANETESAPLYVIAGPGRNGLQAETMMTIGSLSYPLLGRTELNFAPLGIPALFNIEIVGSPTTLPTTCQAIRVHLKDAQFNSAYYNNSMPNFRLSASEGYLSTSSTCGGTSSQLNLNFPSPATYLEVYYQTGSVGGRWIDFRAEMDDLTNFLRLQGFKSIQGPP